MKKENILTGICILITLMNIALSVCFIYRSQPQSANSDARPTRQEKATENPDVHLPEQISLAGEAVPLNRLDVREALKKELIVNTYLHSHTIQILKNAPRMFALIEPILKANGIPDDFKYLAVIESRLDPLVVSPAGAVGIWQIMKGTAKELGLEVTPEVDERYHIEKSTQAAADYLNKAYRKFGSWTLAAASYNAGSNMISRQMDLQQQTNYYNLLLGEETERYVFRILALKQIMNQPEMYHFKVSDLHPAEETQTIKVSTSIKNWAEFAREQGITYKTLKRFNPWLRKNELHNPRHKTYQIKIPVKKELYL